MYELAKRFWEDEVALYQESKIYLNRLNNLFVLHSDQHSNILFSFFAFKPFHSKSLLIFARIKECKLIGKGNEATYYVMKTNIKDYKKLIIDY